MAHSKQLEKKTGLLLQVIRDWQLMIIIGVIVAVDFILLIMFAIYEGVLTEATLVVNKENPSDETGVSSWWEQD